MASIHTPARRAVTRARRSGGRRLATALGAGLIAVSLASGGYVAWEIYGDPLMDPQTATQNVTTLKDDWTKADGSGAFTSTAIPGTAIALLRIPDFGASFEVPIVKGVDDDSLRKGVGWFEQTAKPGEIGNFAVAGHRGGRGPFVPLPDLMPGAKVIVETREATYTYVLDNHPADQIVTSDETWVVDPVPGKPAGTKPTQALITLVTCAEFYHANLRAVAFGHLVDTQKKA